MAIEDSTIQELIDMLQKNDKEEQVNLLVGGGIYKKRNKQTMYSISISIKECKEV